MGGLMRRLRDERGVALPLALVALVAVTLLVSTALVTSSTELAISSAHQDAAESLYVSEGGLEAYVAEQGVAIASIAGMGPVDYTPAGGSPVRISVVHLGDREVSDSSLVRLFSVRASPAAGGRTIAALVTQVLAPPTPLRTNITAALTIAGDLDVAGSAFQVSGRLENPSCGGGAAALRLAQGSHLRVSDENSMSGFVGVDGEGDGVTGEAAVERSDISRTELALDALGGKTLEQLIEAVPPSHRWGKRFAPSEGSVRPFSGYVTEAEGVAVVDGDGGLVLLQGGTGMLIIVNGDLQMDGDAQFNGVIIVEGSFRLHGQAQVNGALIVLATAAESSGEAAEVAEVGGGATVQYDRCEVDSAAEKFGEIAAESMTPEVRSTYGWQEVVR